MDVHDREMVAYVEERLAWLEEEMEAVLGERPDRFTLYAMLRYHLGWLDETSSPTSPSERRRLGGKKLRGLLCLVSCEAAGGDVRRALPAAAAVELIHNFSLIHDDVEDQDTERRHRPTVWVRWGVAHAVNAGSNMQALVNRAGLRLFGAGVAAPRVLKALDCLTAAMLAMTEGQYRDIQSQDAWDTSIDDYLAMASGKTAALMEAAARLGALVQTESSGPVDALSRFGRAFGLAFQARDDYLGIWGERDATGKPVGSDIAKGKRSLPIVYALSLPDGALLRPRLERRDVPGVMAHLEAAGARPYVAATVAQFTRDALSALECADLAPGACRILRAIATQSLGRES
jgi:geranylgeranyl diphosphate synthase type I